MPPAYTNVYLIKLRHCCDKYCCFVLQNTIIVSLLHHKDSVQIMQCTLRSQFKTCLLRHKIIQSLGKKNTGVVKPVQKLVTHVAYSTQ